MRWKSDYDVDYGTSQYRRNYHPGQMGMGGWRGEPGGWSGYRWMEDGPGYRGGYRQGYDTNYPMPPRRSPTYGRRGDAELRNWARHHGYDTGYEIGRRPGRWTEEPVERPNWGRGWMDSDWNSGWRSWGDDPWFSW
jgi:hypothetical protein